MKGFALRVGLGAERAVWVVPPTSCSPAAIQSQWGAITACYLNAAIDFCTREIVGWALDVRCRAAEASTVIEAAVAERVIGPGELTLGTDNGTAFTSRAFRTRLAEHRIVRRRGGYRDPESQAFIESGFSKLKQRCVWREEFETLDEARERIGAYIDGYHHRPHQGLAYRTPREVAATWKDHDDQSIPAA